MKKSDIKFSIELDDNNIPQKIYWPASDNPDGLTPLETRAITISTWDHMQRGTMKIDLWNKDMEVPDMKRFIIDSIGGLGECVKSATNDGYMHSEIIALCDKLMEHVKKEEKSN